MTTICPLTTPIEVGGRKISEVTFRRPTGKDFRAIGNITKLEDTAVLATLVQNLGGLTAAEFDALDGADVVQLIGIAAGFFGAGSTGTPSRSA